MRRNANQSRSASYEMFMLGLCAYVLVVLAVETFFALDPRDIAALHYIDTTVCFVFLADFLYKFMTAESKLKYFFTWGWIEYRWDPRRVEHPSYKRLAHL